MASTGASVVIRVAPVIMWQPMIDFRRWRMSLQGLFTLSALICAPVVMRLATIEMGKSPVDHRNLFDILCRMR